MIKKIILLVVFVIAGYSPFFAADFSDLRIKRDELIAQRDAMDSKDYCDALTTVLTTAIDRQLTEKVLGRVNAREHFANVGHSIAQQLFDELCVLKKEHNEYPFSLDQVVIIDISRIVQDEVRQAFASLGTVPAGTMTLKTLSFYFDDVQQGKAAKIVFDYLQEQGPNKTIAIAFHPYWVSSFENLLALLRHELAHLTQSDWQTGKLYDGDIRKWMEIDADIKAMCEQNAQGEWQLSKNYEDIIDNLYEGVHYDELHSDVISCLCNGLHEKLHGIISDELNHLCYILFHSFHPSATNRKRIMLGTATVIKKIGSLSDSEMEALTINITKAYYIKMKEELGESFLNKAKQAEKILISNQKINSIVSFEAT